ncbi:MAG TPA: phosphoadenosine phosphosulfate reductase family protein [Brevundimonas diminuta]|nr:phosphoadenosine phosphosulfate reductase family protein [Brevundimonas diminuta]HRL23292.1 phosphoadenosine phosphosulfate reductase family protein [Brevundimonas diminuta]
MGYAEEIGGPGPRPFKDEGQRIVAWYSDGDASAVAAMLALHEYGPERVVVARIDVGSEHPDNERFRAEVEAWLGVKIVTLKSEKYVDTWDVWETEGYLRDQYGAPCTRALKRNVRESFAGMNDIQVFGFTHEEQGRAEEFAWRNPEIMLWSPLIENMLTKNDCHAIVSRAGIEIPAMYRLGYLNNNCIGCVKGGMWYWNKIRRDFPEVFARMAKLERKFDFALLSDRRGGKRRPLFLDELEPNRGRKQDEPKIECSVFCQAVPEYSDLA